MKRVNCSKILTFSLIIVLVAAMALLSVGCAGEKASSDISSVGQTEQKATKFDFVAVFPDGTSKTYHLETEQKTVGDALIKAGLIAGEDSEYGLYVKTVCGVTLDFDTDKKYWAFYENGKYASKGVDKTEVVGGTTYMFKADE